MRKSHEKVPASSKSIKPIELIKIPSFLIPSPGDKYSVVVQ